MQRTLTRLLAVGLAVWTSCGREPAAAPPTQPERELQAPAMWRPPAQLPGTEVGVAPLECGLQPPQILGPAEASVLTGAVTVSSPLVGGQCTTGASVSFKVVNTSSIIVHSGCDNASPARITWDTRQVPNGTYWITAQRACSCAPCAEYSWVEVRVAN